MTTRQQEKNRSEVAKIGWKTAILKTKYQIFVEQLAKIQYSNSKLINNLETFVILSSDSTSNAKWKPPYCTVGHVWSRIFLNYRRRSPWFVQSDLTLKLLIVS